MVFVLVERVPSFSGDPVTIRYVEADDFRRELRPEVEQRFLPSSENGGMTFEVTNHTQKTVLVCVRQIEVRAGAVWTNFPLAFMPGMRFSEGDFGFTTILKPH